MKYRIVKTYESADCNEYNVFRANSRSKKRVAYIIEYFVDMNNQKFDNALFEVYYEYNREDDEFVASAECDSIEECLEYLD
jgi:hypothetical protein